MPNHVHLIAVPQSADGLRRAIGEVHRRYTRMVNFREGWRGHLWQGRFASFVIDKPYLLTAARYVELNPVRAGLIKAPIRYKWSSAAAHVRGKDDALVRVAPLIKLAPDWRAFPRPCDSRRGHQCPACARAYRATTGKGGVSGEARTKAGPDPSTAEARPQGTAEIGALKVAGEPAMNPVHLAVLRTINTNDGKFSWYQIDRALSQQRLDVDAWPAPGGLMPVLRELEQSVCVTTTVGQNPSQPLYSITLTGHRQLEVYATDHSRSTGLDSCNSIDHVDSADHARVSSRVSSERMLHAVAGPQADLHSRDRGESLARTLGVSFRPLFSRLSTGRW